MNAGPWKPRDESARDALSGIRVLDASGVGAFASMLLADFGADVIRVASPPSSGKKFTTGGRLDPHGLLDVKRSAAFNALHRGQRSISLNLKSSEGRSLFVDLARGADVLLESFRPGVMSRLGVGYEQLAEENPRLIYCSLSGYGQTGPYSNMPGHDINYIAMGGLLAITRRRGSPPTLPINFGADFAGGALYAAFAILVALQERARSGVGQHIDLAMSDGVLSLLTAAFVGYFADGEEVKPEEYALNGGAPWYDVYPCSDGKWLALGCIEPYFFAALCRVLEMEELAEHEFQVEWYAKIRSSLATKLAQRSRDEWMLLFESEGIAASAVLEMNEVPDHKHVSAREMVATRASPFGPVRQIGVAPKLSRTPGAARGSPPAPGRDTRAILAGLGLNEDEVSALVERGVAFEPSN